MDPFSEDAETNLGRRALEDATEAPAQARYEPNSEQDLESEDPEVAFSGEEGEWYAEEIGPIEADDEPNDKALKREAEELKREEEERKRR